MKLRFNTAITIKESTVVAVPRPLRIAQRELGLTHDTMQLIAACPQTSAGLIEAHANGTTATFFRNVNWTRLAL